MTAHAEEIDLSDYETNFYSLDGEDGILAKIVPYLKPAQRTCVELGAADGFAGSATCLLRLQGWDSLLLERSFSNKAIHLYQEFITPSNINALFEKYQVPQELGFLSIDLDYNDFYIWQALDEKYKPIVIEIEYNALHGPKEDKVVKCYPFYTGDGTNYFGASILALYKLGRQKGYSLVYADKAGLNLYFIRDDFLKENNLAFKNCNDVQALYRSTIYVRPADPKQRSY